MAMTKKEKEYVDGLLLELKRAKAFRQTNEVLFDVAPPTDWRTVEGWSYNLHTRTVYKTWSTSVCHGHGDIKSSRQQRSISQYSTRLLALRALRHDVEQRFIAELMKIDDQIHAEIRNAEVPNVEQ